MTTALTDLRQGHTPGEWEALEGALSDEHILILSGDYAIAKVYAEEEGMEAVNRANARLIAAAPDMLEALHEGRRAIGDHFAPNDCYATGPVTGDPIRDLVECPACSFIAMHDAVLAKIGGAS